MFTGCTRGPTALSLFPGVCSARRAMPHHRAVDRVLARVLAMKLSLGVPLKPHQFLPTTSKPQLSPRRLHRSSSPELRLSPWTWTALLKPPRASPMSRQCQLLRLQFPPTPLHRALSRLPPRILRPAKRFQAANHSVTQRSLQVLNRHPPVHQAPRLSPPFSSARKMCSGPSSRLLVTWAPSSRT